jgi:hypothetical protein
MCACSRDEIIIRKGHNSAWSNRARLGERVALGRTSDTGMQLRRVCRSCAAREGARLVVG